MDREFLFEILLDKIKGISEGSKSNDLKLDAVCMLLKNNVPDYDWVGFYLIDQRKERELVLGPYAGEPTEHVRIPFGEGICGQAANSEQISIIADISKERNYLSCDPRVKSEIVIPILKNGKLAGELDIDSHTQSAFNEKDRAFLAGVCEIVAEFL
jgi:L-methionine (R)-S-oxide reductase